MQVSIIKVTYRRLRSHWLGSLLLDGAMIAVVFLGISAWQTRNLLSPDEGTGAPAFTLTALDGKTYSLADARGRKVLLYFFAPWCNVCNLSAHNLEDMHRKQDDDLAVVLVAISYGSVGAVRDYAQRHGLTMPILLDDGSVAQDYRIAATPTYYVLDEEGTVLSRSVGYSTEMGMRWRTL